MAIQIVECVKFVTINALYVLARITLTANNAHKEYSSKYHQLAQQIAILDSMVIQMIILVKIVIQNATLALVDWRTIALLALHQLI